jgi:hypothetical protein
MEIELQGHAASVFVVIAMRAASTRRRAGQKPAAAFLAALPRVRRAKKHDLLGRNKSAI